MDRREVRMAVGLMKAEKSAFSYDFSLIDTSFRQKMMRSLERRELATLRKIFSKMEL